MDASPKSIDQHPARPEASRWIARLLLVLAVAILVRLAPVLCAQYISPDVVEFLDIARHLRETGQPLLSVKAYYYETTPIVHYGGCERSLLPAVLLGLGRYLSSSPVDGGQWITLIATVLSILFLILTLRRTCGANAALAAGLVIGVSPVILTISLYPWSEPFSLLACAAMLWALGERHASSKHSILLETLVGLFAGAAIAMRSLNLVCVLPAALYLALYPRPLLSRLRALVLLGAGPVLFFAINAYVNVRNGYPALMLPQGFLYRTFEFNEGILKWRSPEIAPSAIEFLRTHSFKVIHEIIKQTIGYTYTLLLYHEWLFVWWVAIPLIAIKAFKRALHPINAVALCAAILQVGAYAASWSTYDPRRFLFVPLALLLGVFVAEVVSTWSVIRLPIARRISISLPRLLIVGTLLAWGLVAGRESFIAFRSGQTGKPYVAYIDPGVWNDPALPGLLAHVRRLANGNSGAVASPFPWETQYFTYLPSVFWPTDINSLQGLNDYLKAYPAQIIIFDPTARPNDPAPAFLRQMPQWKETRENRFVIFSKM